MKNTPLNNWDLFDPNLAFIVNNELHYFHLIPYSNPYGAKMYLVHSSKKEALDNAINSNDMNARLKILGVEQKKNYIDSLERKCLLKSS